MPKKKETIIVMSAHSDDFVIGAGGTIAEYIKQGKKVISIVFSYGEKSHPWLKEKVVQKFRIQETKDKRVRLVSPGRRAGKEAITHWSLEKEGPVHSLVRIKIDTGRRAQIRLHMAALTTPVVGDTRHGFGKASVNRLCLHASSLEFDHPNGARQAVESPIPKQLLSELNLN